MLFEDLILIEILLFELIRTELTSDNIDEINNSKGIICTDALYSRDGFRYGFIPSS